MAHNIKNHDKQQGIRMGWHNLTDIVPDLSLDNNWLNTWDVVPVTLSKRGVDTRWSILECSDNGLEIGAPYNPASFVPVDNKAFVQLVRDSIGGTGHKVASVGSIRNRGRVFISVELAGMEQFKAAGRNFSAFLNFGNGHDKSSVLWVNTSNTCTVCDNTFSANLVSVENKAATATDDGDDISLRQRHCKNVKMKLPGIADLVDKAIGVQAEFRLAMDSLDQQPIALPAARNLFAGFIGRNVADVKTGLSTRAANTVSRLVELHKSGKGNRGETLADAFSAVTDYYTHFSSGGENVNRQIVSSEYGAGLIAKRSFWNLIQNDDERTAAIDKGELLLA